MGWLLLIQFVSFFWPWLQAWGYGSGGAFELLQRATCGPFIWVGNTIVAYPQLATMDVRVVQYFWGGQVVLFFKYYD